MLNAPAPDLLAAIVDSSDDGILSKTPEGIITSWNRAAIGLPVMDGYELAERLRRQRGLKHLRLIAVTGYGQPSDHQQTLDAGFEHHVVKPVAVEDLVALIAAGATDGAPDPA